MQGGETAKQVKTVVVDRSQMKWEVLDLETLIGPDHAARAIWNVCGHFDLSRFEAGRKTRKGEAGRPCWPARLLVSIWVYSYTQGIASARAIARMVKYEPGLRWLVANQEINAHTLSDFRVGHGEALREVFAQFLTLLEAAGLVDLSTLLQDGTKIRAVAGKASMHRRKTLEKRLGQARKLVKKMEREAEAGDGEGADAKREAAQRRAAEEALERAKSALARLKELEQAAKAKDRGEIRVSETEPEARKMKQTDGGWAPSYNVQVTTEAASRMIVAVGVTTAANDTQELVPALEAVEATVGTLPERVIADNGYATRANVEAASERGVELVAPWKDELSRAAGACKRNGIDVEFGVGSFRLAKDGQTMTCPAGKTLVQIGERKHHGVERRKFVAREEDCAGCAWKARCCGNKGAPRQVEQVVESEPMRAYLARMKRPEVRQLYKRRCEVAEFPHLWAKGVKGWRRFSVRGLVKAGMEALWVALAYNVVQWMRVRSEQRLAA